MADIESKLPKRIKLSLLMLAAIMVIGSFGYKFTGGSDWTLLDGAYMTVITLSTVGYGETHSLQHNAAARIFTMFLILSGAGVLLFVVSSTTAFIVEGELSDVLWRKKMRKEIERLEGHHIICGGGKNGFAVIEELVKSGLDTVLIENNEATLEHLRQTLPDQLLVVGDAMEDETLLKAGVERAAALVAALPDDRDNLFLTISVRDLNSSIRIVAKCVDPNTRRKLVNAGADAVVSPYHIGGLRMASEIIRPTVVTFLDTMLRHRHGVYRIEEVRLGSSSELVGVTLAEAEIPKKAGVLVLAVHKEGDTDLRYNPPASTLLQADQVLVVLGEQKAVAKMREIAG